MTCQQPTDPIAVPPQAPTGLEVSIDGIELRLLANRGIYWDKKATLFIADTHFGKEATFRQHGIPVPRGSTQATLTRIAQMISECRASRLVLLGDMFHARSSISQDIRDSLNAFFVSHPDLRFSLVLGNHDRGILKFLKDWNIEIVPSGTAIDALSISHHPQEPSETTKLLLCGHIHPAFRFSSPIDSVGKLACFWLSNRQLVLPAIGQFTGTQMIQPSASDQTWVIVEDRVLRV